MLIRDLWGKSSDPAKFMGNFKAFSLACGWIFYQSILASQLSLVGEASIWFDSPGSEDNFQFLKSGFFKRFMPNNYNFLCYNELIKQREKRLRLSWGFLTD